MKQMQDIRNEIVPLIRDTCMALTGHANDNEVAQMLGTAVAESSLIHRVQIDGGPARGIWQMEPATAQDIFRNYLQYRFWLQDKLTDLWLGMVVPVGWIPEKKYLAQHLEIYDDVAGAMARIRYLRDPDPIPNTLEGQAEYWKRIYNTEAGAGTVEHYLAQWDALECDKLMED